MAKRIDYTFGQQIGMLRFVCLSGIHTSPKGYDKRKCLVICDDGHITEKFIQDFSCKRSGCFICSYEKDLRGVSTHGMGNTRIYACWQNMKERCNNPYNPTFSSYGGRGIKVCGEWLESFESFYEDMKHGYADELSLDRIDVNGNYCKENCRWTTKSIQGFNQRIKSNNTSGKSGVTFYKDRSMWVARISVNTEEIYLGMFSKFEDAVEVREAAELKYFGFNKE